MFENEVAISITTAEGATPSFFMPADSVKSFSGSDPRQAIPVEVVDRSGEYGVVTLPRRTFEGSNAVKVPARALVFA
ncbi:MAG TPA: hypothetical protein VM779_01045 [Thermoanaerobaculia bacterium]|nr:hypothetical protein [Thermoanaerobaculia bacterium]